MQIKRLSLYHFRNFDFVEQLDFPEANLLVAAAPNATGKTNFLESVVVLLRGKSFRAGLEECVGWGEQELTVQGVVEAGGEAVTLAVGYHQPRRRLTLLEDQEPISPVAMYARYPLVLFLPDDTFLFARGPGGRRNFLNHVLISRPTYVSALVQFQRSLKQRNAALKTARERAEVEAWTELLLRHGEQVWSERRTFGDFLASHLTRLYQELTGETRAFMVRFVPGAQHPEAWRQELERAFEAERRYHYTLSGPHRDDLEIFTGGRAIASVLSRGQMRGVVVALKVASWHFLHQVTQEKPLLLFDEVLSELDEERQNELLTHLPAAQVLLTCTRVPEALRGRSSVHFLDLHKLSKDREVGQRQAEPEVVQEEKVEVGI